MNFERQDIALNLREKDNFKKKMGVENIAKLQLNRRYCLEPDVAMLVYLQYVTSLTPDFRRIRLIEMIWREFPTLVSNRRNTTTGHG